MDSITKPPGAQVYTSGSWYKIGLRGLPFVWIDGEWKRSNKPAHDLRKHINKQPAGAYCG